MIKVRRANERGHANHGWLDTHYTFSFSNYYDPRFMGFRSLRVINEDFIEANQGFPTHGHRDMEILTYVMSGELSHKDSMGNGETIRPKFLGINLIAKYYAEKYETNIVQGESAPTMSDIENAQKKAKNSSHYREAILYGTTGTHSVSLTYIKENDKEVILTNSSVVRYETYEESITPPKNKDPDWTILFREVSSSKKY